MMIKDNDAANESVEDIFELRNSKQEFAQDFKKTYEQYIDH